MFAEKLVDNRKKNFWRLEMMMEYLEEVRSSLRRLTYEKEKMSQQDYETVEEMREATKSILDGIEKEVSKMNRILYAMEANKTFYRSLESMQYAISEKKREMEEWEEIHSTLNYLAY